MVQRFNAIHSCLTKVVKSTCSVNAIERSSLRVGRSHYRNSFHDGVRDFKRLTCGFLKYMLLLEGS